MQSTLQKQTLRFMNNSQVPRIYETDHINIADKELLMKFFTPDAQWTWYAWEAELVDDNDIKFFGSVDGLCLEIGYFLLSQLDSIKGHLGLPVELDFYPNPKEYQKMLSRLIK